MTTYTNASGNTAPLIQAQSNGSGIYYTGLVKSEANGCLRFPTTFYKTASTTVTLSAATGTETDSMMMDAWLVPYTASDNGKMDGYYFGKSMTAAGCLLEVLDGDGALYLVNNQVYLKIG